MPHLKYRNLSASDFKTWCDWVRCVNDAQEYCRTLDKSRLMEWRFKCHTSQLPSFHPYWKRQVHLDNIKRAAAHLANLRQIEKNPALIKSLYNKTTTIEDVRKLCSNIPKRQKWINYH